MANTSAGRPNRITIRLSDFDFSQPGGYFVTINTKNRRRLLGEINQGSMHLSEIGKIVKKEWEKIPYRFRHGELDEYVIMPDHFHGIFIKHESEEVCPNNSGGSPRNSSGSLGVIIRSFKSSVSVRVHQILRLDISIWQRNYYEEFIEDEDKLDRIREYVRNNPIREYWGD